MTVRSNQLAAVELANNTLTTVYTVPTGYRTIVKSILLVNTTGAAQAITSQVWDASNRLAYLKSWHAAFGASGDQVYLAPWLVMLAGQRLRVAAGTGGAVVLVSGAELFL